MINRVWGIASVIVIAAILGLGWLLGISPLLAQAAAADLQRVGVEQGNQAQALALAQMQSDFERLDELQSEVDALRLSIPSEVDSDFIYAYLSGLDGGALAIDSIVTGEAQTYGAPTVAEGAAAEPSETPATVAGVENLYTVPVTITFRAGTPASSILAFAGALQNGPRIFVITNIAREVGAETAGTITAYMFVISAPDDSPGSTFGDYDGLLDSVEPTVIKPWGPSGTSPTPTPTPTGTATPNPTESATPTPTPTNP